MEAPLYFDGSNSYWAIDYIVNDVSTQGILAQAIMATPDIHETGSVHNNSGTHDKLFFLGNGGVDYNSTSEYRDKVWANQKPFILHLHGIKEYSIILTKDTTICRHKTAVTVCRAVYR